MKILLSWIDLNTDMEENKKTGEFGGPTLETIKQEEFDLLYLFASSEETFDIASQLKRHVDENRKIFKVKKVSPKFVKLYNPTDYQELWEAVPKEIEVIKSNHAKQNPQLFINISAGTPAMRTTWMMMVGSSQIKATILNVQRVDATKPTTIDKVNVGIYPFVSQLKRTIDKQMNIPQVFESSQMISIMRRLRLITDDLNMPILLLGETGTGKTTIASMYHLMTGAPIEKFFHYVCGEFDVGDLNTLRSELFGHVAGAFTGANSDRDGILKKADGGTLFLDEIGDIPERVQRLLINAVEKKEFRPMGSKEVVRSDFRLVCATNRDIKEMLKNDELAKDFYNRIRSCEYLIPPLRERREDIPAIVDDLLDTDGNYKMLGFGEGAKNKLINRISLLNLDGNIRDIQQILNHLTIQSKQPKAHPLSIDEIEDYFQSIPNPTQNSEFEELVIRMLNVWPHTTFKYQNYKWQEALVEVALKKLTADQLYKKKNGDLNINKISALLGIDNKTIKSRLSQIQSK